jgi:hypothetical protein
MRSDEIMTDTEQTEQAATLVIAALDSPTMEEDSPDAGDDSDSANGARVGAMRKVRQNFTTTQLAILECVFNSTPLPRKAIRAQLAEQLGLPQRSVQVWFQNRCATPRARALRAARLAPPTPRIQRSAETRTLTALARLLVPLSFALHAQPSKVEARVPAQLDLSGLTAAGAAGGGVSERGGRAGGRRQPRGDAVVDDGRHNPYLCTRRRHAAARPLAHAA